ncbi:MAG: hypothetical protein GXP24_09950 [Planctomycetes bacterium]|nr:hypothetical protein [Planctomycetota bacterium]
MSVSQSTSEFPPAYLITFRTYGSWLHGDTKGSVDRVHNRPDTDLVPPDERKFGAMQSRMSGNAVTLDESQRLCVEQAIAGVCEYRAWELLTIHVRTNHVHVVVAAPVDPEKVMNDFKVWATRKLRKAKLFDADAKIWSRHGSTRYLWDERAKEDAGHYTVNGQGVDLSP